MYLSVCQREDGSQGLGLDWLSSWSADAEVKNLGLLLFIPFGTQKPGENEISLQFMENVCLSRWQGEMVSQRITRRDKQSNGREEGEDRGPWKMDVSPVFWYSNIRKWSRSFCRSHLKTLSYTSNTIYWVWSKVFIASWNDADRMWVSHLHIIIGQ